MQVDVLSLCTRLQGRIYNFTHISKGLPQRICHMGLLAVVAIDIYIYVFSIIGHKEKFQRNDPWSWI